MNNLPTDQLNNNYDDEIDLRELFHVLRGKLFYIGVITSIFSLISIIYALMLPNIYQSQAMMMATEENEGMGGVLQQYSGMASLAGISLPSESSSKTHEAIARIESFEFFSNSFLPHIKLEDLMAVKKWNQANNTLTYDASVFDSESLQWVRKANPPRSIIPSSQEAYEEFNKIMGISLDKKTSFVTLSVDHQSPFIAQQWVAIVMEQIDQLMRDKDKQTATQSIEYLNSIAPNINYEEVKQTLSSLQQEQIKRLMMVEANNNYVFKVLDSPIVPEERSKPNRLLIVMLGSMLGMMFSVMSVLVFHYTRKSFQYDEADFR
ncbi:Wzz/FepE/Etk N-terminal domain-containing protein [Gammaproteobacteria bacterium]|nr:Wzz/FepE/Etk N-terminal domain-containing protein [Gammaproteobacteria bacterium]MDB4242834.1 Wzz/FepE/Etk N-terminal domain-containing protein [Gammaproteobacteria bacterium]